MYNPYMQHNSQQKRRVMTVTGVGNFLVEPNIIEIQLEVSTENKELSQAQQENAIVMNQVMESLLEVGINKEDIKTVSYNINSQYDYIDGRQVFRGYEVTNAINVKITNIEEAGRVIDTAVRNGVNRVSTIQFKVENEQLYYQQALSLALKDALAKAQTIAGTMQLQFDPHPIKIVEEFREQPIVYRTFSAMEQNASTPIQPGQITISATVNVQFQY